MSVNGTDIYLTSFQDDKVYVLDTLTNQLNKDTTAPTISEVTPITTPTTDTTPDYTFTTDEAGTISYGGDCTSTTTSATLGSNTITFNTLSPGTYSNCTITVSDASLNISNTLTVTSFTISAISTGNTGGGGGGGYIPPIIPTNTPITPDNTTPTINPNPIPPHILLTKNLKYGITDAEVKLLQTYLNNHGFKLTSPTDKGVGSPGKETTYFGLKTKASVILFQKANKLVPDAIVGPKTRGVVNSHP